MKYFKINYSDNLKEIGNFPQVDYKESYNPSITGILNIHVDRFPDFKSTLELDFLLNSIPADYLVFLNIPMGKIVSEKMKNVLVKFNLPDHKFYPVKVYYENQVFDYYWFYYIIEDFWELIDKENSYGKVLNIDSEFSMKRKIPAISKESNKKEVLSREYNTIKKIHQIRMKKEFPNYDFYLTQFIENKEIISQPLKEAIEKEGITGMEIKPFDEFIVSN